MKAFGLSAILVLVYGAVGCGGGSSFVVHGESERPIKNIALLSIPPTGDYFLEQVSQSVLERAPVNSKNANYIFQRDGFDLRSYMEEIAAGELGKKDIQVKIVPVVREDRRKFVDDLANIDAQLKGVDAVLDVVVSTPGYDFGPYGERSLGRLRPMLGMRAQLRAVPSRKVQCRDRFAYGYDVRTAKDEMYVVEDVKVLESRPALAIEGLKHAGRSLITHMIAVCNL